MNHITWFIIKKNEINCVRINYHNIKIKKHNKSIQIDGVDGFYLIPMYLVKMKICILSIKCKLMKHQYM